MERLSVPDGFRPWRTKSPRQQASRKVAKVVKTSNTLRRRILAILHSKEDSTASSHGLKSASRTRLSTKAKVENFKSKMLRSRSMPGGFANGATARDFVYQNPAMNGVSTAPVDSTASVASAWMTSAGANASAGQLNHPNTFTSTDSIASGSPSSSGRRRRPQSFIPVPRYGQSSAGRSRFALQPREQTSMSTSQSGLSGPRGLGSRGSLASPSISSFHRRQPSMAPGLTSLAGPSAASLHRRQQLSMANGLGNHAGPSSLSLHQRQIPSMSMSQSSLAGPPALGGQRNFASSSVSSFNRRQQPLMSISQIEIAGPLNVQHQAGHGSQTDLAGPSFAGSSRSEDPQLYDDSEVDHNVDALSQLYGIDQADSTIDAPSGLYDDDEAGPSTMIPHNVEAALPLSPEAEAAWKETRVKLCNEMRQYEVAIEELNKIQATDDAAHSAGLEALWPRKQAIQKALNARTYNWVEYHNPDSSTYWKGGIGETWEYKAENVFPFGSWKVVWRPGFAQTEADARQFEKDHRAERSAEVTKNVNYLVRKHYEEVAQEAAGGDPRKRVYWHPASPEEHERLDAIDEEEARKSAVQKAREEAVKRAEERKNFRPRWDTITRQFIEVEHDENGVPIKDPNSPRCWRKAREDDGGFELDIQDFDLIVDQESGKNFGDYAKRHPKVKDRTAIREEQKAAIKLERNTPPPWVHVPLKKPGTEHPRVVIGTRTPGPRRTHDSDGAEWDPEKSSNPILRAKYLADGVSSKSKKATEIPFPAPTEPAKSSRKLVEFFNLKRKPSGNLVSKLFSFGSKEKYTTDLLAHKKNKASKSSFMASSSENAQKEFQLTPLSELIEQSFVDMNNLKQIHAAQSSGIDRPGLASANGGDRLVGKDGTIVDFDAVMKNLQQFKEEYYEFLKHGGNPTTPGWQGIPLEEVYLVAMVQPRSEVTKGKMGAVEGIPMTRVPDCGM